MIDYRFLWAGIAIMLIIIVREILRKKCNFDMDSVDVKQASVKGANIMKNFFKSLTLKKNSAPYVISKNTGNNSLVMLDSGANKATVAATLRQITGIDLNCAKSIVNSSFPSTFMTNISQEEADLTKKALEFVGAKIEIK